MIINTLLTTNSSIEKQKILKLATEEEKRVFQAAYNPYIMYYVNFDNIDMSTLSKYDTYMFNILDRLASRELSGKEAYETVITYCRHHGDLLKLICNKDLSCGVSSTTLNKVFGKNFIPTFKVQLATEVPIEKVTLPIMGQIKYNGIRVIALIKDGTVELKTRRGLNFSFPALEEELSKIKKDIMLDGELCVGDSQNSNHTYVGGLVNSARQGNPITNTNLVYNVFDGMPLDIFNNKLRTDPYYKRLYFIDENLVESKLVRRTSNFTFETLEDINNTFTNLIKDGYEGLILKPAGHRYSFKRCKDWIKVKETKKAGKDADLECIDIKYGSGKYKGLIGSLVCKGIVEGKSVQVSIGTGLTDKDRILKPNYYVSKYIEVKYNCLIQNKQTGQWSLFLPRFVQVREDK